MTHASPAHVRDVKKPVNSTQINKSAKIGNILYYTDSNLIVLKLFYECLFLLRSGFLQNLSPAYDNIPATFVQLDNPEIVIVSKVLLKVGYLAQRNLRTGKECFHSHDLNLQTTFNSANDGSFYLRSCIVGIFDVLPHKMEVRLFLRYGYSSILIFKSLDKNIHRLSGNYLLILPEFVHGNNTFTLVIDIYNYFVSNPSQKLSGNNCTGFYLMRTDVLHILCFQLFTLGSRVILSLNGLNFLGSKSYDKFIFLCHVYPFINIVTCCTIPSHYLFQL